MWRRGIYWAADNEGGVSEIHSGHDNDRSASEVQPADGDRRDTHRCFIRGGKDWSITIFRQRGSSTSVSRWHEKRNGGLVEDFLFLALCCFLVELELELIQTQTAQKPVLLAGVYARALHACQNVKKAEVLVGARCA
jgi:hypothetical protein